jgi:4-hydroxy-4-methyl-2-oxoglutarate aldolase
MAREIPQTVLHQLAEFDSCTIADAIETFSVRLRNEGFNDPTIRCFFPSLPPMVGFARTFKVKTSEPPMDPKFYLNRATWNSLDQSPLPKVIVIEDVDAKPGRGALVGKTHASILEAFGCKGVITNGAIRGVKQFEKLRMPAFASSVSVSHAYGHLIESGTPVNIAGVHINPGDLIHGDANGIVNVPLELAEKIPDIAQKLRIREQNIALFCLSSEFSPAALQKLVDDPRKQS